MASNKARQGRARACAGWDADIARTRHFIISP